MAKKVNKPKPQTVNINPTQPQTPKPKSNRQVGQYDKIFQENLEELLPHLIKEVLGMDIVHREQLPTRVQHTQERDPDIFERVQLKDLSLKFFAHRSPTERRKRHGFSPCGLLRVFA